MEVLVGALLSGGILRIAPGQHSLMACFATGALLTVLLRQIGPRSMVERTGFVLMISLIAWIAGPRAASGQSLVWHLLGWLVAGAAVAYYLAPKPEPRDVDA
jgi:hypothetical protein